MNFLRLLLLIFTPHAVLASDNPSDRNVYASLDPDAVPEPGDSTWNCFEARNIAVQCHDQGWDTDGHMSDIDIIASNPGARHGYGYRHGVGISICRSQARWFKAAQRKAERVCIQGGSVGHEETDNSSSPSIRVYSWVWDRAKTAHSCISYWEGGCATMHRWPRRAP